MAMTTKSSMSVNAREDFSFLLISTSEVRPGPFNRECVPMFLREPLRSSHISRHWQAVF